MYLLDTNVVSELRLPHRADRAVRQWLEQTEIDQSYLSVISVMEIERGVLRMERRDAAQGLVLRRWFKGGVLPQFNGRILDINTAVALQSAALHIPDRRPEGDALIAATALVHGLTVVTRNVADFKPMGVTVLNPWESP